MEIEDATLVLVHDGWQGAWEWENVQRHLVGRGWGSATFDLPGHGALYQPQTTPATFTLEDYAVAVVDFVRSQIDTPHFVLVGHGFAGPICQRACELLQAQPAPSQLAGLILMGAFVLRDGEAIADSFPPQMTDIFQQLAQSRPDYCLAMSDLPDFWRFSIMSDDIRQADAVLARLHPEPLAPLFEKISLKSFFVQPPLCAYLSFNDDNLLPPGGFYPQMANKLGQYRHNSINTGHAGPLTKPREVAEALIFLTASSFDVPNG